MKGGGEALFIGVVAPSGSDGAPDVDFRLGAFFQPVDVLAVRPDEQCGDDEREDDERHRVVDFGRQQHEDRKTASRDHRRERHVVRNHQHDEPDTEAEQDGDRMDTEHGAHQRRHAFAALEVGEDGEDVSQHGGEYGDDFQVDEPDVGDVVVVFEQAEQCDGHEAFQHVEREDRQGGPSAQHAQHVGGAGVAASVFADVDAVIFLTDPHRIGNRSQQVGYKYHGDSTVICQDHR